MKATSSGIVLVWLASLAGCFSSEKQPCEDTLPFIEKTIGRSLPRDAVILSRSKEEDTRDSTFFVLHGKSRLIPPDQNTVEIPAEDAHRSVLDFLNGTSVVGKRLGDKAFFTILNVPSGQANAVQLETEQGWYLILELPRNK